MPDYKNIPVDTETYQMLLVLCDVYDRKQGAQVKSLVKADYERLEKADLLPKGETKKNESAKQSVGHPGGAG